MGMGMGMKMIEWKWEGMGILLFMQIPLVLNNFEILWLAIVSFVQLAHI